MYKQIRVSSGVSAQHKSLSSLTKPYLEIIKVNVGKALNKTEEYLPFLQGWRGEAIG